MVHTRFMSSVLWLLFVLNALRGYSCTHPHQDFEMEQSNLVVDEDNVKGFLDDLSTTRTRKVWFGGRKMVVRKEIEKDEISGANCYDMIKCERNFNVKYWKVEDSPLKKFNKKIGFVAFGDDYHGPKHHTPKHN